MLRYCEIHRQCEWGSTAPGHQKECSLTSIQTLYEKDTN